MEGFRLNRDPGRGARPLSEVASGLEAAPSLVKLFGTPDKLAAFLRDVTVKLVSGEGYMWIDDETGELCISRPYLEGGPERGIYVDLVHELVHVKQFREGKDLFDQNYTYVERPTELEAYRVCVEEARRVGMSEAEIEEYLRVPWISAAEHARLCKSLGLKA